VNWRDFALCKGMPTHLWFPNKGSNDDYRQAAAICAQCPVQEQCLEDGLYERYGIWGGLSLSLRRKITVQRFKDRQALGPAAVIFDQLKRDVA
jgi:hypothetical protein